MKARRARRFEPVKRTIATLRRARAPRWVLPVFLLSTVTVAGCSRARADEPPATTRTAPVASTPVAPRLVRMGASWAEYFDSMADLKAHADLAVVGTVSSIAPAVQPAQGPVFQMVTISVERAPWTRSATSAVPGSVTFEQTGGTYDGVTFEVDDDPLFQAGDRVIMFFTEYSPGKYRVTGGPTGRFTIAGGRVVPMVPDGLNVGPGTGESAFVAALQSP
jgi:hypothetical protein